MTRRNNWRDYDRSPRGRIATTIRTLDAISRTRALSEKESDQLYQAIRDEQRRALRRGASC